MAVDQTPFVLLPGEGRPIPLGSFAMTVKADGSATAGAFAVLEAAEPSGFGPPLHIHHDAAEAFYVLEGEYLIYVVQERYECPQGSFIYIPAGIEHGFRFGEAPSRKLNLYIPAGMVGYFDELSAELASGGTSDDHLAAIAAAHNMEITGDVPEGYL